MNNDIDKARLFFDEGLNLYQGEKFSEAEKLFKQALSILPHRISILINLSATLIQLKKWSECQQICNLILQAEPNNCDALINLCVCAFECGDKDFALNLVDKAVLLYPQSSSAWVNKGNILQEVGIQDEACKCFERALTIDPKSQEALIGRGNIRNDLQLYALALEDFDAALLLNPLNAQAKWNKSLSLLRLGDFLNGWKLYESRWEVSGIKDHQRFFNAPLWLGCQSLESKTILIHAEQGYGDSIQFCRYVPHLQALGAKVILQVPKPLSSLMMSLDPKVEVIETLPGTKYIDFHCPIMSLPLAFQTTLDSIPNTIPYLSPNESKVLFWRNRLEQISAHFNNAKNFRVGVTWSGSGHYAGKINLKRELSIEQLSELIDHFSAYEVEFHSLQPEVEKNRLAVSRIQNKLMVHHQYLNDFDDTAALIKNLNLVVSIDTATGHLAGALNTPTLLLVPHPPDFMSLINRTDSPWYPSHQLIRQEPNRVWPTSAIFEHIKHLVKKNHP